MGELLVLIAIISAIVKWVKKSSEKQQPQGTLKRAGQHPMSPDPFATDQPQPAEPATTSGQTLSREEIDRLKGVLRQRMEGRKAAQTAKPVVSTPSPAATPAASAKSTLQSRMQTEYPDQRLVSTLDEGVSANYQFGRQRVGSSGASQTLSGYTEGDSPDRCAVPHEDEIGAGAVQVNSRPFFEGKDDLVRAVVLSEVLGQPASRKRKQTVGGQAWRNR